MGQGVSDNLRGLAALDLLLVGLGVLTATGPVPNADAFIEAVVKDARAASAVAVDGTGEPLPIPAPRLALPARARRRNLATVKFVGDAAGRPARGVELENLTDNLGF